MKKWKASKRPGYGPERGQTWITVGVEYISIIFSTQKYRHKHSPAENNPAFTNMCYNKKKNSFDTSPEYEEMISDIYY